jgi:hypothetical protein
MPTALTVENDPGFCKPSKRHRLSNFWGIRSRNRQRRPRARTHNTPNTTRHDITAQQSNLEHSPDQIDKYPCFLFKDEFNFFVIFSSRNWILSFKGLPIAQSSHTTHSSSVHHSCPTPKAMAKRRKKIKPRPCIALPDCSSASPSNSLVFDFSNLELDSVDL